MARNRERGRSTQKRERAEVRAAELRREGRNWYYRAVLAVLAAVPLALVTWLLPALLAVVVLACLVKGTRLGFRANELLDD